MDLASYVKTAKSVITANSPVLLLGTTIAGVVTTGVLSAKAGYKARGIVDEAEGRYDRVEEGRELSLQEKMELTWLCYASAGISAAGTIAAAVGTHTVHTKRANAMAALYAVTSNKLDDYAEKAEELLGPKKTQELQNQVGQKAIERGAEFEDNEVIMIEGGTELCHDDMTGRYFMSSVPRLESAINEINRQIIDEGDASLNDFYERIGLSSVEVGDYFGWSGTKIDARFGSVMAKDGRPAISVWFQPAPKDVMGQPSRHV